MTHSSMYPKLPHEYEYGEPRYSYFWGGPLDGQRLLTDGRYEYLAPKLVSPPTAVWENSYVDDRPTLEVVRYLRNRFGSYEFQRD